jgi:hypothetical protein
VKEEEARWHSGCWLGVDGLAAPVKGSLIIALHRYDYPAA